MSTARCTLDLDAAGCRSELRLPLAQAGAPIAQSAEAVDLKSIQCGFESHWGHKVRWSGIRHLMQRRALSPGPLQP